MRSMIRRVVKSRAIQVRRSTQPIVPIRKAVVAVTRGVLDDANSKDSDPRDASQLKDDRQ